MPGPVDVNEITAFILNCTNRAFLDSLIKTAQERVAHLESQERHAVARGHKTPSSQVPTIPSPRRA